MQEIHGKQIINTENNEYGLALIFSDNTYAILEPTTSETIAIEKYMNPLSDKDRFKSLRGF